MLNETFSVIFNHCGAVSNVLDTHARTLITVSTIAPWLLKKILLVLKKYMPGPLTDWPLQKDSIRVTGIIFIQLCFEYYTYHIAAKINI